MCRVLSRLKLIIVIRALQNSSSNFDLHRVETRVILCMIFFERLLVLAGMSKRVFVGKFALFKRTRNTCLPNGKVGRCGGTLNTPINTCTAVNFFVFL